MQRSAQQIRQMKSSVVQQAEYTIYSDFTWPHVSNTFPAGLTLGMTPGKPGWLLSSVSVSLP
jgi:hypothetical protein